MESAKDTNEEIAEVEEDIEDKEEDIKSHLSAPEHVDKLQRTAEPLKGVIKKKETKEEVKEEKDKEEGVEKKDDDHEDGNEALAKQAPEGRGRTLQV